LGLGLELPDIGPNRILGLLFQKAQKNWFWSIGLEPNPISLSFSFFFISAPRVESLTSVSFLFFHPSTHLFIVNTQACFLPN
jgi:hypothetical protein